MPGKTEICFESICGYLAQGKKVGFAISRRQVVLEIANRLRRAFPELSVCEVAQGYTQVTDADLIVCTTHQLYRYPYAFDLLILVKNIYHHCNKMPRPSRFLTVGGVYCFCLIPRLHEALLFQGLDKALAERLARLPRVTYFSEDLGQVLFVVLLHKFFVQRVGLFLGVEGLYVGV